MTSEDQESRVIDAIKQASERWKRCFNKGDAAGCAAQYEEEAVMEARPFGTFKGRAEIEDFWGKLINDGFSDVEYMEPVLQVMDESSGILSARWKMNKASGVIHEELWVIQANGIAKLREDIFEAKD